MLDMIIAVLILCFIIGAISSALFVASLYLYKESRRSSPATEAAAPAVAAPAATAPVSGVATTVDGERATTAADGKRRSDSASCRSSGSDSGSCSYTCEVCGSCCAADRREAVEVRTGQGDHCQQLQQLQKQQMQPPYPCGELFISGTDVGFKCLNGDFRGSGGGGGCDGTFFFQRGRQPGELLDPVRPSARYLTMAALPSVPYHMWFCPARHPVKSRRCPDCSRVFSFELCDSEIRVHHRGAGGKRRLGGVWLLACEEAAAGESSILYQGDAASLTSLRYAGKLFLYFGLPEVAAAAAAGGSTTERAEFDINEHPAQGDLRRSLPALVSSDGGHRPCRGRNKDDGDDANGDGVAPNVGDDGAVDGLNCETDTNTANSELSISSLKTQSPLSMGSVMRKAVKWPITQIENLMESSSSDERQTPDVSDPRLASATETDATAVAVTQLPQATKLGDANVCYETEQFSAQLENCEDN